ncbi:hypothetical protein EI555_007242 [Monodon monoceros]|uniref:Calumenin n=1 Tax=Monodon monoceros TaxID=40151 RepID=A0A4U1F1P7_MONMO|nr:hypothetical protein EI555_007242 [Monodon monoceros]
MAVRGSCASAAGLLVIGPEAAGVEDSGGARSRFRLGGACAPELSRWVSCSRGILGSGRNGESSAPGPHPERTSASAKKVVFADFEDLIIMDLRQFLTCLSLCTAFALSKPTEKKDRVHHEPQLSDKVHNDAQSFDYDHDAFLGAEEAKTFDQLTPEESKERLGKIVSKIDGDKDGFVTVDELKDWIKFAQKRWIYEDVERQWKGHDLNEDGLVSWEEYKNATYGYVLDDPDPDDGFNYKQMMVRDERRFKMADKDGDLIATKEEFTAFLHPEEYDYMKDIVVQETMEDIDKNADGFIDLEEYIGDMYSHDGNADEPEWVKTEREQFVEFRDKNRDGKMDKEETKDWILPSDYDHAEAEARHLVYESDQNKDGKLTKEEIVDKYDLFVGSQATDFGEALGLEGNCASEEKL